MKPTDGPLKPQPDRLTILWWVASTVILIAAATFFALTTNWTSTIAALGSANWLVFATLVPGFFLLNIIVRGVRWTLLGTPRNLSEASAFYFGNAVSQGVAEVTPAQSGELLKVELAARHTNSTRSHSLFLFTVERGFDTVLLSGTGIIACILLGLPILASLMGVVIPIVAAISLACLALLLFRARASSAIRSIQNALQSIDLSRFSSAAGLTLTGWGMIVLAWWYVFQSAGIDVPLMVVVAAIFVATAAGIATLMPGGLGPSDVTVFALLLANGAPADQALTATILLRTTSFYVLLIAGLHALVWQVIRPTSLS